MSPVQSEIAGLEEQLRQAELGPDPDFFQEALADDAVLVSDGIPTLAKEKVVEAHRPGKRPKFNSVEMSDMLIVDHGVAAVVTCQGTFHSDDATFTLDFMRVWAKKNDRWQIVAGSIS
ncbi:MAG TPA: nuclear transport factor 2 family protein [Gemmatimonadaceae bacterium]|nr:nuclear transport factor 2 family protein [Gemmatimonadaceae bacterium]